MRASIMSCDLCKDIFIHIKRPKDLSAAIEKTIELINSGKLAHTSPENFIRAFERMSETELWDDLVENHFECTKCGNHIWLHAETYHGGGGALESFKEGAATMGNDEVHT